MGTAQGRGREPAPEARPQASRRLEHSDPRKGKAMVASRKTAACTLAVATALALALGMAALQIQPQAALASPGQGTVPAAQVAKAPAKAKVAGFTSMDVAKATVSVNKVKGAAGYQYKIAQDKALAKGAKVKTSKKRTVTFSKLAKGKKYYVKVRAYKKVKGKKVYGKWSAAKAVKVCKFTAVGTWQAYKVGYMGFTRTVDPAQYLVQVTMKKNATATLRAKSPEYGDQKGTSKYVKTSAETGEVSEDGSSLTFTVTSQNQMKALATAKDGRSVTIYLKRM